MFYIVEWNFLLNDPLKWPVLTTLVWSDPSNMAAMRVLTPKCLQRQIYPVWNVPPISVTISVGAALVLLSWSTWPFVLTARHVLRCHRGVYLLLFCLLILPPHLHSVLSSLSPLYLALVFAVLCQSFIYIYIYTFSRRFYPKRLTVHSGYTFFNHYVCSLGIEPTTFCAANAMLYHWATGTLWLSVMRYSEAQISLPVM